MLVKLVERIVFDNEFFRAIEITGVDTQTGKSTKEVSLQQKKSIDDTVYHLEELYKNQQVIK